MPKIFLENYLSKLTKGDIGLASDIATLTSQPAI